MHGAPTLAEIRKILLDRRVFACDSREVQKTLNSFPANLNT